MHTILYSKILKGGGHLEGLRCRWADNIKTDFEEIGWRVWSEFFSFRIVTGGGLLCTR
jgi:hypothetical protein